MEWSRLGSVATDALVVSFGVGAIVSPPDPFTQLLYVVPTFLVALVVLARYGERSVSWWRRYLLFVGNAVAFGVMWQVLAFAVGEDLVSGVRPVFLLAGVVVGAWLAYFGGWSDVTGRNPSRR